MITIKSIQTVLCLIQVSYTLGASPALHISGGADAMPGEFPYQALIQHGIPPIIKYQPVCGGSIINDHWILTAAQCINLIPWGIGKVLVKAGKHDLHRDGEYVQTSEVLFHLVHRDYHTSLKIIKLCDIGLLKLKTPFELDERVQPVTLPKAFSTPRKSALLTGWGSISSGIVSKLPKVLQVATVEIITEDYCNDALHVFAPVEIFSSLQVCTGPLDKGIAACAGDVGDPLVQIKNREYVQIGIASWGPYPCGRSGSPTIFTLTSAFVNWIDERIAEN